MKRYILFAGENYYPKAGAYGMVDSFDSFEEIEERLVTSKRCSEAIEEIYKNNDVESKFFEDIDWYQVFDTEEKKLVRDVDLIPEEINYFKGYLEPKSWVCGYEEEEYD